MHKKSSFKLYAYILEYVGEDFSHYSHSHIPYMRNFRTSHIFTYAWPTLLCTYKGLHGKHFC